MAVRVRPRIQSAPRKTARLVVPLPPFLARLEFFRFSSADFCIFFYFLLFFYYYQRENFFIAIGVGKEKKRERDREPYRC